jgi:hypothetical protein
MNAPVGILEMDAAGAVVFLNAMSRTLLAPFYPAGDNGVIYRYMDHQG